MSLPVCAHRPSSRLAIISTSPQQSLKKHDRFVVATACTFLAGKTEETPKKLQEVVVEAYNIRHEGDVSHNVLDPKSQVRLE